MFTATHPIRSPHRLTLCTTTVALFLLGACEGSSANPDDRGPLGKADIADGQCSTDEATYCDGKSAGSCYCDTDCEFFGDCCTDYVATCDASVTPQLLINEGLHAPESVAFDPSSGTYYVTNLAVNILEADPNDEPTDGVGFVSRHAQDGSLLDASFVTGLNSPKGVVIVAGIVYVADPKAIVAYDTETGAELARYTSDAVGLLNDLAIDPEDGSIYVTDTSKQAIYQLDRYATPSLRLVAQNDVFDFPNGLAVLGDDLVMGSTGVIPHGALGFVFTVDKYSGAITKLEESSGRWDGVVALPDGTIAANDFATGELFRIDRKSGAKERLLKNEINPESPFAGIADMNLSGTTLLIPSMFTNEVYLHTPAL